MGMNYYLKGTSPITVTYEFQPYYHIGKFSCGWKPSFEINPSRDDDIINKESHPEQYPEKLNIESLNDIIKYAKSGDFIIENEEGEEVSLDQFLKENEKFKSMAKRTHIDYFNTVAPTFFDVDDQCTEDEDGNEFLHYHFS